MDKQEFIHRALLQVMGDNPMVLDNHAIRVAIEKASEVYDKTARFLIDQHKRQRFAGRDCPESWAVSVDLAATHEDLDTVVADWQAWEREHPQEVLLGGVMSYGHALVTNAIAARRKTLNEELDAYFMEEIEKSEALDKFSKALASEAP